VELVEMGELRRRQAAQNTLGASRRLGVGIATYIEACGGGGIKYDADADAVAAETAEVRLTSSGGVEVTVGTTNYGMGHITAWAQIVSEVLGVDVEQVTVVQGDTGRARHGYDSYGSRSLSVAGSAIHRAATQVRDNAVQLAAHMLEADPKDIIFESGVFSVAGTEVACTLAEVAQASYSQDAGPAMPGSAASSARISATSRSTTSATWPTWSLRASATTACPSALDVPSIETDRCSTPAAVNALGAKGAGECGAIAAPPAVINAVIDALRPLGVTNLPMPATPVRVWNAIQAAARDGRNQLV
jgi:carbon-monoxide dehydrogenase large subunit